MAVILDKKSPGTPGGTFNAGAWRTRDLNTIVHDDIGLAIGGNQVVIPAGTFLIHAIAPAYTVNRHQARWNLNNVSYIYGNNAFATTGGRTTVSEVIGVFSNVVPTQMWLEHQSQASIATWGFGFDVNSAFATNEEVYSQLILWKVG